MAETISSGAEAGAPVQGAEANVEAQAQAEKVAERNREAKDAWEQRQRKQEQNEQRKQRRGEERIVNGEMPRGRDGEEYAEWMKKNGAEDWIKQEQAREKYQKMNALINEWENQPMPAELYKMYPMKPEDHGNKEAYLKRVKALSKMELGAAFPRETVKDPETGASRREETDEWGKRILQEAEKPSKLKTPDEMVASEDADNFRELTDKNPQQPDESDKEYWARLCWLNDKQKALVAESAEQEAGAEAEGGAETSAEETAEDAAEEAAEEQTSIDSEEWTNAKEAEIGEQIEMDLDKIPRMGEETGEERDGEAGEEADSENEETTDAEQGPLMAQYVNEGGIDAMVIQEMNRLADREADEVGFFKKIAYKNMLRTNRLAHFRTEAMANVMKDIQEKGLRDVTERRLTEAVLGEYGEAVLHGDAGEYANVYRVEQNEEGQDVVYKIGRDKEGNEMKELVDGNSPEAQSTIETKKQVAAFAEGKISEEEFTKQMQHIQNFLEQSGKLPEGAMVGNQLEIAKRAKDMFDHGASMEDVMKGFSVLRGQTMNSVRTEQRLTVSDKILEKVYNNGGKRVIPPEVIATVAGAAVGFIPTLAKMGARTATTATSIAGAAGALGALPVVGALAPAAVAGAAAGGVVGAFREKYLLKKDRARQARDLAAGVVEVDNDLSRTQYEMRSAQEATTELKEAITTAEQTGDKTTLMAILAETELRKSMSDQEKMDLFKYSGEENIEAERMELDVAIARAKVALGPEATADVESYKQAMEDAQEKLSADIDTKEKAYKKLERKQMTKQGVKMALMTLLIGGIVGEVLERTGLDDFISDKVSDLKDKVSDLKDWAKEDLLGIGDEAADVGGGGGGGETYETVTETQTVPASTYFGENGAAPIDKYATNMTDFSDGNELAIHTNDSGDPVFAAVMARATLPDGSTVPAEIGQWHLNLGGGQELNIPLKPDGTPDWSSTPPEVEAAFRSGDYEAMSAVTTGDDGKLISLASMVGNGGDGLASVTKTVTKQIAQQISEGDAVGAAKTALGFGIGITGRRNYAAEGTRRSAGGETPTGAEAEGEAPTETGETPPENVESGAEMTSEQLGPFAGSVGDNYDWMVRHGDLVKADVESRYPGLVDKAEDYRKYMKELAVARAGWQSLPRETQEVVLNFGGFPEQQSEQFQMPAALYQTMRTRYDDLKRMGIIS